MCQCVCVYICDVCVYVCIYMSLCGYILLLKCLKVYGKSSHVVVEGRNFGPGWVMPPGGGIRLRGTVVPSTLESR